MGSGQEHRVGSILRLSQKLCQTVKVVRCAACLEEQMPRATSCAILRKSSAARALVSGSQCATKVGWGRGVVGELGIPDR